MHGACTPIELHLVGYQIHMRRRYLLLVSQLPWNSCTAVRVHCLLQQNVRILKHQLIVCVSCCQWPVYTYTWVQADCEPQLPSALLLLVQMERRLKDALGHIVNRAILGAGTLNHAWLLGGTLI